MKTKKIVLIVIAVFSLIMFLSACSSVGPKCSQPYSKIEKVEQQNNI